MKNSSSSRSRYMEEFDDVEVDSLSMSSSSLVSLVFPNSRNNTKNNCKAIDNRPEKTKGGDAKPPPHPCEEATKSVVEHSNANANANTNTNTNDPSVQSPPATEAAPLSSTSKQQQQPKLPRTPSVSWRWLTSTESTKKASPGAVLLGSSSNSKSKHRLPKSPSCYPANYGVPTTAAAATATATTMDHRGVDNSDPQQRPEDRTNGEVVVGLAIVSPLMPLPPKENTTHRRNDGDYLDLLLQKKIHKQKELESRIHHVENEIQHLSFRLKKKRKKGACASALLRSPGRIDIGVGMDSMPTTTMGQQSRSNANRKNDRKHSSKKSPRNDGLAKALPPFMEPAVVISKRSRSNKGPQMAIVPSSAVGRHGPAEAKALPPSSEEAVSFQAKKRRARSLLLPISTENNKQSGALAKTVAAPRVEVVAASKKHAIYRDPSIQTSNIIGSLDGTLQLTRNQRRKLQESSGDGGNNNNNNSNNCGNVYDDGSDLSNTKRSSKRERSLKYVLATYNYYDNDFMDGSKEDSNDSSLNDRSDDSNNSDIDTNINGDVDTNINREICSDINTDINGDSDSGNGSGTVLV